MEDRTGDLLTFRNWVIPPTYRVRLGSSRSHTRADMFMLHMSTDKLNMPLMLARFIGIHVGVWVTIGYAGIAEYSRVNSTPGRPIDVRTPKRNTRIKPLRRR